jgi:hypothetical protein
MSKAEESDLLERTDDIKEHFRELEKEGSRFRAAASRAVHNGRNVAQRWGRQTRIVAANATDRIKDDPALCSDHLRDRAKHRRYGWAVGRAAATSIAVHRPKPSPMYYTIQFAPRHSARALMDGLEKASTLT